MAAINEKYYWPGMKMEVRSYIFQCPTCQAHQRYHNHQTMSFMPEAKYPFQIAGIDMCGPFVPSAKTQARYLITIIDHYSGSAMVATLLHQVFTLYVFTVVCVSDDEPQHHRCSVSVEHDARVTNTMGKVTEDVIAPAFLQEVLNSVRNHRQLPLYWYYQALHVDYIFEYDDQLICKVHIPILDDEDEQLETDSKDTTPTASCSRYLFKTLALCTSRSLVIVPKQVTQKD
ncbi:hypothetical protein CAPTEDRAFT_201004 [Capitella teleta]|uniref:Integrase zinc-binding domain-containing protein n=1 Tax=Capitella teleta TaxID=283909 RepID=R7UAY6_CAPTE|nr:hypothetical protein CAPTEDRAFT_201004 [Capitella teleta]|eukprot:ELU03515.1 hypothetical protein CAPTEDRAFT_201004 [Capitella teleta]